MRNIPKPNTMQLRYHKDELAAFMHFGMNTFTDSEWGDGTESPKSFNPSGFEADKMVKALKDAGFKRLVVTAKHHDGFCIWPSKYTDHTVASSPYKGDILAELSKACSEHGLDMGLYLSPWDVHEPSYGYGDGHDEETDTNGDYNQFFINQVLEISENPIYGRDGRFVEWWLDGAKGTGSMAQWYDFPAWIKAIRKHNPDILIFGAGSEGGVHWVGNESGFAPDANWCLLPVTNEYGTGENLKDETSNEYVWSIPEVDVSLNAGWFWHEGQEPKSPEQLADIYFDSVGRGSPLLLNIPPNNKGDYPDEYYDAIKRFGENIKLSFRHNVADPFAIECIHKDENSQYYTYRINFQAAAEFDCFELKEAISSTGQLIDRARLSYIDEEGQVHLLAEASTVGARRLFRHEAIRTDALELRLHSIGEEPQILSIGAYLLTDDFKPSKPRAQADLVFEEEQYTVKSGQSIELTLTRDDSSKDLTFYVDTPPGTAVSGQYYKDHTHIKHVLAKGISTTSILIETHPAKLDEDKDFYIEVSHEGPNGETAISRCRMIISA